MMNENNRPTCKDCDFCREDKGDPMQQGVGSKVYTCYGKAPVPAAVPVSNGHQMGVQILMVNVSVSADRPACHAFRIPAPVIQ